MRFWHSACYIHSIKLTHDNLKGFCSCCIHNVAIWYQHRFASNVDTNQEKTLDYIMLKWSYRHMDWMTNYLTRIPIEYWPPTKKKNRITMQRANFVQKFDALLWAKSIHVTEELLFFFYAAQLQQPFKWPRSLKQDLLASDNQVFHYVVEIWFKYYFPVMQWFTESMVQRWTQRSLGQPQLHLGQNFAHIDQY